MLALLALAAVASAPPFAHQPVGPAVQATATVRILSGVRLELDGRAHERDIPKVRDAIIKLSGADQPARLIEFQ
jgi:hypothetical protein